MEPPRLSFGVRMSEVYIWDLRQRNKTELLQVLECKKGGYESNSYPPLCVVKNKLC